MMIPFLVHSSIDLEENIPDFVLETKRIKIPGYPFAFNPSIIRWEGRILMTFRNIPNLKSKFDSLIGIVWLDDELNVVGEPQILNLQNNSPIPSRAEDARLFIVNDRLFITYSDNRDKEITKGGFRVYLAELIWDGEYFHVENIEAFINFEGESKKRREKNWVPFEYNGDLLLSYSLEPHLVFQPIFGTKTCNTVSLSEAGIDWKWGILRGGTPALPIDDEYLAFFHSSIEMSTLYSDNQKVLHYFIGAYTFSREPPFTLKKISPYPIVGRHFYKGEIYKPYWHPIRAVFPCGYIFDENYLWIAYGRQDHETWVVKLDREGLMSSLKLI